MSTFAPSPVVAFHENAALSRDGRVGLVSPSDDEQAAFCTCCARPVYDGAVILAGEACCSIECALEMGHSHSGPPVQ